MILNSILFILSTSQLVGSLKYTEENSNTGLIFIKAADAKVSYDTYTIVYHIDLGEFVKLRKTVENCTNVLEMKCKNYDHLDTTKMCVTVARGLKHQLSYMIQDEKNIMAYQQNSPSSNTSNTHSVHKRAIEWIGSIFHWMSGVVDADTARKYDAHINQIGNETSRLQQMNDQQLFLIRETIGTVNNEFRENQRKFEIILDHIQPYLKELGYEIDLIGVHTSMQSLISEHQRIARKILKSLENAMSNTINHLIPVKVLAQDLLSIQQTLPINQMFPINFDLENPLTIFKYSKTAATIYNHRLLLELTLPVIERQEYIVYEIIPVPIIINNKTIIIKPSTNYDYILINTGMTEYIPISKSEFHGGHTNFQNAKIISPHESSHLDFSDSCETSIFLAPRKESIVQLCDIKYVPTMNYFTPISYNNIYFVTISKPITVLEMCVGKPIISYDITKSGNLILEDGCQISTDKISIRPHTDYRFESESVVTLSNQTLRISLEAFTDKINVLKNITFPTLDKDFIISDHSTDLDRLAIQADKLIEEAKWKSKIEEIHYDNVGRSYIIYWIIGIVVTAPIISGILVGIYVYYKFYNINTWIKLAQRLGSKDHANIPNFIMENIPLSEMSEL